MGRWRVSSLARVAAFGIAGVFTMWRVLVASERNRTYADRQRHDEPPAGF